VEAAAVRPPPPPSPPPLPAPPPPLPLSPHPQRPIVDYLNRQLLPLPLPLSWRMILAHVLEQKQGVDSNPR
jgi:hypothetical protein